MSNPIFNFFNPPQTQSQPIQNTQQSNMMTLMAQMMQIRNSPNPDVAMQNLINSSPQLQGIMQYINQNGGDAKSAFYNMAAQQGVDPNPIINQVRSLLWQKE